MEEVLIRFQSVGYVVMCTLLAWSVLNVVAGSVMRFRTKGFWQGFWDMCAMWNVVNMLIALGAMSSIATQALTLNSLYEYGRVISFNGGLNFAYMASGVGLYMYAKVKKRDRWRGYGVALVVQGIFLLAIDLSLLFIALPPRL